MLFAMEKKAAVSWMSTVRTLLEEQLPSAGPDVAGWFRVTRDGQNMEDSCKQHKDGSKEHRKREGKKK